MITDIGPLIAALYTLMVFSYLYKENIFFRLAEKTFIGGACGYLVVMAIKSILATGWTPLSRGNYVYIIPFILGILFYTKYSNRYRGLSIWPAAVLAGTGIGVAIKGVVSAQIVGQIKATFLPVVTTDIFQSFNNIIIIVGTVSGLLYFFFTKELKIRPLREMRTLGLFILMVTFGALFGANLITRTQLFIGRIQFLLFEWLGLIPP